MTPTEPATRRIEYLPLDDIAPAERNPKGHAVPQIVASIRRFGWTSPVVYDERTERLVAGHGRLDALRQIRTEAWGGDSPPDGVRVGDDGAWLVPVVRGWASVDDAHADAYIIADNRLTETGGWDDRLLAELLEDVRDVDPDLLSSTGYTSDQLDDLLFRVGPTGDLAALAQQYGEPDDAALWPRISIRVPRSTRAAFVTVMGSLDGEEHEQFAALVTAAAENLHVDLPDVEDGLDEDASA